MFLPFYNDYAVSAPTAVAEGVDVGTRPAASTTAAIVTILTGRREKVSRLAAESDQCFASRPGIFHFVDA